jgi:hypothetical protein
MFTFLENRAGVMDRNSPLAALNLQSAFLALPDASAALKLSAALGLP